jgi:hypothetical protein
MQLPHTNYDPIDCINLIEVFEPTCDDFGALCYPVHINNLSLTFHKNANGGWQYKENALLPKKIIKMVEYLIENGKSHL